MPFLNFTWEIFALELSKRECFGLGCCGRSLIHATFQWHTDASWNALPSHLFLTLIKTCVEEVYWHSNEEWVTTVLCIQKRNVSAAAQSSFPYITKGQSGLKIFFSIELLQSLLFVCMGVWRLFGLNFSRTAKNFNSCSPFLPSSSLNQTD